MNYFDHLDRKIAIAKERARAAAPKPVPPPFIPVNTPTPPPTVSVLITPNQKFVIGEYANVISSTSPIYKSTVQVVRAWWALSTWWYEVGPTTSLLIWAFSEDQLEKI